MQDWTQEEIDDQILSHTDHECWECQGEGVYHDECQCEAFEDICCCAEPTPRRCNSCSGTGRQDDG